MYIPNHKVILKNVLGIGRRCLPESAVFLNYNEWFRSESYRNEVAGRLRLPTSHKGLSVVWIGSGFDNVTDATKLSVFDRWREYEGDEGYRSLFKDEELVELASHFWKPPFAV